MGNASVTRPVFARGSTVLDYWLAHAAGLTVQPSGARVEEVISSAPAGRAETLIVRTRLARRLKEIPADSIVAVEPSLGHLLVDRSARRSFRIRIPRPSPERIAAARAGVQRGGHVARARAAVAVRVTNAESRSALRWLRPRAARAGRATLRLSHAAAAGAAAGIAWLAPRVAAGAAIGARKLYASTRRTSVSGKTPS